MSENWDRIPESMKSRPQWVLWKLEPDEPGSDKLTKKPYQIDGRLARANDPSTWTSFEKACAAFARGGYTGIGYEVSKDDPFAIIDLDGCRNSETGEVAGWALQIVECAESYTEISPSKTGLRIVVEAVLDSTGKGKRLTERDAERIVERTPGLEIADARKFFTMTGDVYQGFATIKPAQRLIDELVEAYFSEEKSAPPAPSPVTYNPSSRKPTALDSTRSRNYLAKIPGAVSGQGGDLATYKVAQHLIKGFCLSESDALPLFLEWNSKCKPEWLVPKLRRKLLCATKSSLPDGYLLNARPEDYDATIAEMTFDAPPSEDEAEIGASPVRVTTFKNAMKNFIDDLKSGTPNLISTGLDDLDDALGGGIAAGEMVVITGRPSHGKTMLALQIIHHCSQNRRKCLLVSEETPARIIAERTMMHSSEIEKDEWELRIAELEEFLEVYKSMNEDSLIAEGCSNIDRTRQTITDYARNHGVGLAAVDYLQLLDGKGNSRYEKVTNVSMQLRQCAGDLQIPLLVLCQLNRDVEDRDKFIPRNSDIRDSGQIEQDASVIIHCMWPHLLDESKPKDEYWLTIGKNKNRGIRKNAVKFVFDPSRMKLQPEHIGRPNYEESFSAGSW